MMSRGALLKAARVKIRLKQRELAEKLNVTTRTIQRYESGECDISLSKAAELASVLEISIYDLVGRKSITNTAQGEQGVGSA